MYGLHQKKSSRSCKSPPALERIKSIRLASQMKSEKGMMYRFLVVPFFVQLIY